MRTCVCSAVGGAVSRCKRCRLGRTSHLREIESDPREKFSRIATPTTGVVPDPRRVLDLSRKAVYL
jgi:hypothetical protein